MHDEVLHLHSSMHKISPPDKPMFNARTPATAYYAGRNHHNHPFPLLN
jgi:hypothetical protein